MKSKALAVCKAAFPKTLPVLAGYLVLGFGFGLLLADRGYSVLWALLMSGFIYAGSMQYVTIDLLATGASLLSAALMTLFVNARHLFYALSVLDRYRDTGKAKPYLAFGLTDETYGLICGGEVPAGVEPRAYYLAVTAMNQGYWLLGSALGSLFGRLVSVNTAGVEFSMTALFLVLLLDKLLHKESRVPALLGLAISLVCRLLFGAERFLLPSMAAIAAVLLLFRKTGALSGEGGDAQ